MSSQAEKVNHYRIAGGGSAIYRKIGENRFQWIFEGVVVLEEDHEHALAAQRQEFDELVEALEQAVNYIDEWKYSCDYRWGSIRGMPTRCTSSTPS